MQNATIAREDGWEDGVEITNFVPEVEAVDAKPAFSRDKFLTTSQKAALIKLENLGKAFQKIRRGKRAGFQPRLFPLLLGATGVGKTALCQRFAKLMEWERPLAIDSGSFIVSGAYTKPATTHLIRDYVRASTKPYCCLFFDEIDKLIPSDKAYDSSWVLSVFSEWLSIVDADQRLIGIGWTQADLEKFRRSCFVVAGGFFEPAYRAAKTNSRKGTLGFGTSEAPAEQGYSRELIAGNHIPPEVLGRLNSDHIVLQGPNETDLRRAILRIHHELNTPRKRPMAELINEGLANGSVRWIENYLSQIVVSDVGNIVAYRDKPLVPDEAKKVIEWVGRDLNHYAHRLTDSVYALRLVVGQLWGELQTRERVLKRRTEPKFRDYLFESNPPEIVPFGELVYDCLAQLDPSLDTRFYDPDTQAALRRWEQKAWFGIQEHAKGLTEHGLYRTTLRGWELSQRIIEISDRIDQLIEHQRVACES